MGNLEQRSEHFVLFFELVSQVLCFLLKRALLVDRHPDNVVHREHLVTQLHSILDGFVSFFRQPGKLLLCFLQEGAFPFLTNQFLLQLLVLLGQEGKGMLQVLIAIDEHLVIHLELVDQVFHKVEVVSVEW